jgi:hypothetical protein
MRLALWFMLLLLLRNKHKRLQLKRYASKSSGRDDA